MKLLISLIFTLFLFIGNLPAIDGSPGEDQQICKADVSIAVDLQAEQSNFVLCQPCNYDKQLELIVQDESPGKIQNEVYARNFLKDKSSITYKKEESLYKIQTKIYLIRNYFSLKKYSHPIRAV